MWLLITVMQERDWGSGGLESEEGGGVLGLGGRCSWEDFSGLGGWGAGDNYKIPQSIYCIVLQAHLVGRNPSNLDLVRGGGGGGGGAATRTPH